MLHEEPREVLVAAYLDVRNHVLGWQQASVGTLSRMAVDPRVILQGALLANADSMLIGHNHPSGDALPSTDDVAFTERLAQAGAVVGIRLVDGCRCGGGELQALVSSEELKHANSIGSSLIGFSGSTSLALKVLGDILYR